MPELWPFPALAPLEEVIEWRTDLLSARAAEQRIALRTAPRSVLTIRSRLRHPGMADAIERARAGFAQAWRVPLWHMAAPVGTLSAGATTISVDTTLADYRVGGHALVIDITPQAFERAQLVEIASVDPGEIGLQDPLAGSFEHATLAPVQEALLTGAPEISRRRASLGDVTVEFTLTGGNDYSASDLPQYEGRDVLTRAPEVTRPVASNISQTVTYVDAELGGIAVEPERDIIARGEVVTLSDRRLAQAWRRRRWLLSLRGRQRPFWMPTWGRELRLRAAMTGSEARIAPIAALPAYVGRHVAIELPGALQFREVTGAVQDGDDHRLTLSGSVSVGVPVEARLHWMPLVRLDTDRVELAHDVGRQRANFSVVEVNPQAVDDGDDFDPITPQ